MTSKPNKGVPPELSVNRGSGDKPDLTAEVSQKYVYVRDVSPEGNVRFDFAIGWPELCVELVLPRAAFDEFCRHNQVREMPAPDDVLQSMSGGDDE